MGGKCFNKLLRRVVMKNRLRNTAIRRRLVTLKEPGNFKLH